MAALSQDPKTGVYRIHFRLGRRQFQKSLKTPDEKQAGALKGRIELTLLDIERGRLVVPPNADLWQFILSDGKLDAKPIYEKPLTLGHVFYWYFGQQTPNAKVTMTLETERIHSRHFLRLLGKSSGSCSGEQGRGRPASRA